MQPSQVRARVLRDHDVLRQRIEQVEQLALAVRDDGASHVVALRQAASDLLHALSEHMGWEDRYLVPALRDADAWGPERVARFESEHQQQREDLRGLLAGLEDKRQPAKQVAQRVLDWLGTLHTDMREEESAFLGRQVLRDDVVGIDVETG